MCLEAHKTNINNIKTRTTMKKVLVLMLMAVMTLGANAQFEKGTHYAGANLTGLGIGYQNGNFAFGLSTDYGYYLADQWMIAGTVGYTYKNKVHGVQLKPYFRYTFEKIGLNLGCGLQYEHVGTKQDYVQLCPQVGYTFFINGKVSIEPALYADFCMNDFKNGTSAGLKIGIGLYNPWK